MNSTKTLLAGRRSGTRRALALAVGVLVFAGCGSSDSGTSDADLRDPSKSPLAKLLGYDTSPAEQKANDLKVQQSIVECMKAEGWEYEAVDYSAGSDVYSDDFAEQQADPVAYGKKYGYGVVRGYDLGQQMNEDGGGNSFTDPNMDYVNSLSSDEQTQYYESLYGNQDNQTDDDGNFVPLPLDQQGCQGKAQLEVYGDSPFNDPDMSQRLQEIFDDAQNDPEVKKATDEWSSCMSDIDSSYDWKTPDEIYSYLYDKLNTAQGFSDGGPVATTVEASGFVGGIDPTDTVPQVDEGAIEDLRAEELQIWQDDNSCQEKVDLLQVRRDAEQRVADQLVQEFPELAS